MINIRSKHEIKIVVFWLNIKEEREVEVEAYLTFLGEVGDEDFLDAIDDCIFYGYDTCVND